MRLYIATTDSNDQCCFLDIFKKKCCIHFTVIKCIVNVLFFNINTNVYVFFLTMKLCFVSWLVDFFLITQHWQVGQNVNFGA